MRKKSHFIYLVKNVNLKCEVCQGNREYVYNILNIRIDPHYQIRVFRKIISLMGHIDKPNIDALLDLIQI